MSPSDLEHAPASVCGLWIPASDGMVQGEVRDFEPSYSTVTFPAGVALPVGRTMEARLAFAHEDAPSAPLEVRVVARREDSGQSTYRILHRANDEFLERLTTAQRALFEARRSGRSLPPVPIVVELTAEGVQGSAIGSMHDISPEGIAVLVPIETDQRFAGVEQVRLEFQLPGDEAPFRMQASVLRRALAARGLIYGLHLVGAEATDLDAEHHRLRAALAELTAR